MAKSQKKSGREPKKPKSKVPKVKEKVSLFDKGPDKPTKKS